MAVQSHLIHGTIHEGLQVLGAIRTEGAVYAAFPVGVSPDDLKAGFGAELRQIRQAGRGYLAVLPPTHPLGADKARTGALKARNVLVAIRNGETAAAASDWLRYHQTCHGADAALIFDRDPPDQLQFANELAALSPDLPVSVVSAERPFGQEHAPDARDAALAPAAPRRNRPAVDPWHAPLGQLTLYELLRHGFLAEARAVAFLDIADLALPGEDSIFDRAFAATDRIVMLDGREVYPWRLRKGRPAPHSDHIARQHGERRGLLSWAAAPANFADDFVWKPGRPRGVQPVETPVRFCRALGVVFPGAPVETLIAKSALRQDPSLVTLMTQAFDANPVLLPTTKGIPKRPATNRVTVVSAMKNEGAFVLDWIAHNRAIGIDRHLIYTNDCEDGTERLLDLLGDAGVTRRDNPYRQTGHVPQHAAFRAAENEAVVVQADWLLTLDVDEYINIHAGDGSIAALLQAVPEAHVISMPWRLFGNSDLHEFSDTPVTRQFARCAPEYAPRPMQAWAFKSLFRNAGLFRRMGVHRPKGLETNHHARINWVDGSGRDFPPAVWRAAWRMSKAQWGYDLVTINHYAVRSAASFLVKRDRGRANHTTRDQGEAYWFRMNHNAEEDHSIRRLDRRVAAEKAALLTLPGVAEAHAAAVAWHLSKIDALRRVPTQAALFDRITSPRMEQLSRMATCFGANVYQAGPQVIPDEVVARDPAKPFFFTVDASPAPG